MDKTSKIILGIGFFIAVGLLVYSQAVATYTSTVSNPARDLVGTRTGTTTAGVGFYGNFTASTTYPILIGGETNIADFTFKTTNSSSTSAVSFSILASNDYQCDSATTTTSFNNVVLANEVNWFDAASNVKGASGLTAFPAATTTFTWLPTGPAQNRTITLTDLSYQCLALQLNGSSTQLWVQVRIK